MGIGLCRPLLSSGHDHHCPLLLNDITADAGWSFKLAVWPRPQEWQESLDNDDTVWDQNAFNDLFRRQAHPVPDQRQDRLFRSADPCR